MTPIYENACVALYNCDCADVIATLPPRSIDLLVTDPPYGISYQSNHRNSVGQFDKIVGDNTKDATIQLLEQILRGPLRIGRHVYIFGPTALTETLPLGGYVELIWDKEVVGLGDLTLPWSNAHERVTFGSNYPSKANREDGHGKLAGRLRKNSVLRCQRLTSMENKWHPTQKPVAILREFIEASSHHGETVFDPFCGVGSTLVAAMIEGRKAIGVEIERKYCDIAIQRCQELENILQWTM